MKTKSERNGKYMKVIIRPSDEIRNEQDIDKTNKDNDEMGEYPPL